MLLSHVVITLVGLSLASFVPLRAFAGPRLSPGPRSDWVVYWTAVVLVAAMLLNLLLRSHEFGTDSATYSTWFIAYCEGEDLSEFSSTWVVSATLLNVAMLGACSPRLIAAASTVLVGGFVLLLNRGQRTERLRFACLFLVSMVGVELTTNALRQGFAAALTVAAISWWSQSRLAAAAIAALAVATHFSAALAFAAMLAAAFGWGWFLLAMTVSVGAVVATVKFGVGGLIDPQVLYHLEKYLGLDADEIWVRVLATVALLVPLVAGWLFVTRAEQTSRPLGLATRIASSSLPFLTVPYFGYRYVYGVFPIVLWLIGSASDAAGRTVAARVFYVTLAGNLALLLAWSLGSTYMQTVVFHDP